RASRAPRRGRTGRPHLYRCAPFLRPEHGAVVARLLSAPLRMKHKGESPGPCGRLPSGRPRPDSFGRMPQLRETKTKALRQADSTLRVHLRSASVRPDWYAAALRTALLASGNDETGWPTRRRLGGRYLAWTRRHHAR